MIYFSSDIKAKWLKKRTPQTQASSLGCPTHCLRAALVHHPNGMHWNSLDHECTMVTIHVSFQSWESQRPPSGPPVHEFRLNLKQFLFIHTWDGLVPEKLSNLDTNQWLWKHRPNSFVARLLVKNIFRAEPMILLHWEMFSNKCSLCQEGTTSPHKTGFKKWTRMVEGWFHSLFAYFQNLKWQITY